jgi:hypothetical protein
VKNTDMITHQDLRVFPENAIWDAFNRRIGSAVDGPRTPSRIVRSFARHPARE